MNAKQFFHVCAGVLLLAVAYQLAPATVGAQGAPHLVALLPTGTGANGSALDSSGRFFWRDLTGAWHLSPTQAPPGTPVNTSFFYDTRQNRPVHWIGMENGDVYTFPDGTNMAQPFEFTYLGNVFGGSVQVGNKSWSTVKDGFRK